MTRSKSKREKERGRKHVLSSLCSKGKRERENKCIRRFVARVRERENKCIRRFVARVRERERTSAFVAL